MRSRAIICYTCIIAGVFVRDASASDSIALLGDQSLISTIFGSWRILLAIGILAALINLLAKSSNRAALGIEIPNQFSSQPVALGLGVTALIFGILSLTPLPTLPLLVVAEVFVLLAWTSYQKTKLNNNQHANPELTQHRVGVVSSGDSILRLELGSSLLSLASPETSGNFVERMALLRATVSRDLGVTIPPIRIKDNLKLQANTYRIYVRGGIVGEGVVYKDRFMVVSGEGKSSSIDGIEEKDPVFGLPAIWITESTRDSIGELFIQAIDPVTVVMTHLSTIVDKHASELLTREDVSVMVQGLQATSPTLVEEVIGKTLGLSRLHHILISLLEEHVSVNDLSTIIETASDGHELTTEECVEQVRTTLRRQICANVSTPGDGGQQVIRCVELPKDVEDAVAKRHISRKGITDALRQAALPLISEGLPIVVVSSTTSRRQFREEVLSEVGDVIVLSRSEIVPEVELQIVGIVTPAEHVACIHYGSVTEQDKQQTIAYAKSILQGQTHLRQVKPASTIEHRIELGIAEIRTLVGEVLECESEGRLSPLLASSYRALMKRGIDPSLASAIVQSIDIDSSTLKDDIQQQLMQELIRRLPRAVPPPRRDSDTPAVIALVGPTGVGKTTTIAKLATKFRLQQGRTVAFVTADTYRIAAVEQLQQYAEIFDATMEIAGTAEQMKEAISRCQSADIILIDTAGRCATDLDRIEETANILQVAKPDEVHLVLSAATSRSATTRAAYGFACTGYDRVIVSKLDEAPCVGEMVSTLCEINKPMSWFTNGQDISTHINQARSSKLVESLWNLESPITC